MLALTLRTVALLTLSFVIFVQPAVAQNATPSPMSATSTSQLTAKVVAIDYKAREVTLQDDKGNLRDFQAGPNVTRFNNLKVGDTVTFTYQESVAVAIAKTNAPMPAASSSPIITRAPGNKPGGTITQTQTTTVTITSIDTSKPSITVRTQDGRVVSFLVQDPKNLNGLKVGDVVQVTYTQALMIAVK